MRAETPDVLVVGLGPAGSRAAETAARAGATVVALEKRAKAGSPVQCAEFVPSMIERDVPAVGEVTEQTIARMLTFVEDGDRADETPEFRGRMLDRGKFDRMLAADAAKAGADCRYGVAVLSIDAAGTVHTAQGDFKPRVLIGADGPRSRVADALGLGASKRFLAGVEYEYASASIAMPDRLHCFVDRRLAHGYIGWVFAGVDGVQAGLARRLDGRGSLKPNEAMEAFLEKIAPVIDLRGTAPSGVRAGLIPCGGVVSPVAVSRALLVGDAAGMVSPVTAGGIHTALKHGLAAGNAVADFLHGRAEDPSSWFVRSYPRFRLKRLLRFLFDHFQSDLAFNWLLATWPMRAAASVVYFHHKGVFDPAERPERTFALPPRQDTLP